MRKNISREKPKIIAVVGPTASGKSALAVHLAKKFGGEVISADSRQIYRGLDIGSGKITKREMRGTTHHLLSVADPRRPFSVAKYQRLAKKAVGDILARGKLPIICGGTGLYVDSVLYDKKFPEVPPNASLRKKIERKTAGQLFSLLKKLDPRRAKTIDRHNAVRLIRAIEIAKALGKVPRLAKPSENYRTLIIGLKTAPRKLKENIRIRLFARLPKNLGGRAQIRDGVLNEAKKLHKNSLSWEKMEKFGLEYRNEALYLQGKITKEKMIENILKESYQYSRRQMTWFRKNKCIVWVEPNTKEAETLVKKFLRN